MRYTNKSRQLFLIRRGEKSISIIDPTITFLEHKKLRSDLLLHRVPDFHSHEELPAKEQGKDLPGHTEIRNLPVNPFIFDQGADLTVKHPVKLRDKDNFITQFPVLGKECTPGSAVFCPQSRALNMI